MEPDERAQVWGFESEHYYAELLKNIYRMHGKRHLGIPVVQELIRQKGLIPEKTLADYLHTIKELGGFVPLA